MNSDNKRYVEINRKIHDKIHHLYDKNHDEIFNSREQQRIEEEIAFCRKQFRNEPLALDFGCGTGNITRHLCLNGYKVVSADVSEKFLEIIKSRYQVQTLLISGDIPLNFNDNQFDLVTAYSVLHHLPDYLTVIDEFARITKPGGLIYLDHEQSPQYWENRDHYLKKLKSISKLDLNKFLQPKNYYHKLMSIFIEKYSNEGDIHVWPDRHIEWNKIDERLAQKNFKKFKEYDYLLFKNIYHPHLYESIKHKVKDVRCCIYMKSLV